MCTADVRGSGNLSLECLRPTNLSTARDCVRKNSNGRVSTRKIRSMDASGARRMTGIVSGVAIEPQPGEQVVCQDLTGE